ARVHQLLLAGVEGVAVRADVRADLAHRRAGLERVAARAVDVRDLVIGVDALLHGGIDLLRGVGILPRPTLPYSRSRRPAQPPVGAFAMSFRKSSFDLVDRSLSISSSRAAPVSSACRTRRRRITRASSSGGRSSSSLRVLEASTLIAGNSRFSESCRSSRSSMF